MLDALRVPAQQSRSSHVCRHTQLLVYEVLTDTAASLLGMVEATHEHDVYFVASLGMSLKYIQEVGTPGSTACM